MMTTMTPTSFGWTLAALAMLAPGTGSAQTTTYGTLADLRASVATCKAAAFIDGKCNNDEQVYQYGSPPEAITVIIALANGGSSPMIVNQDFDEHLHLELYFVGPDGPVRAKREVTTVAPEPPPPNVCLINGEPVQAEPVKAWEVGYQSTVTVPNAHTFYTLPTGVYTVELRAPIATYVNFAPCEPPASFALLDDQNNPNAGEELRSLPQTFTIVGDGDNDNYCYPVYDPERCPAAPSAPQSTAAANTTPVDCDDRNAAVNPGTTESPGNGLDDDCNPATSDEVVAVANRPPVAKAGADRTVTLLTPVTLDGSGSLDPDGDSLTFMWTQRTQSGGPPSVTLTGPNTATPSFTPVVVGDYVFDLKVSDGQFDSTASVTNKVIYDFKGFFQPVDNLPTMNVMKAGAAVPVKFSLKGNQGLNIFSPLPFVSTLTCSTSTPTDSIEQTVTASANSLSYDAAADQYVYVWKTDKGWANSCRQLTIKLVDGTTKQANFKFTK